MAIHGKAFSHCSDCDSPQQPLSLSFLFLVSNCFSELGEHHLTAWAKLNHFKTFSMISSSVKNKAKTQPMTVNNHEFI